MLVRLLVALSLASLSLTLAACGGDGDGSTSTGQSIALTKTPPQSAAAAIGKCLDSSGYGSRSGRVSANDQNAPDAVVFFRRGKDQGSAGEVGVYASQAEASNKLAGIRTDAKSSGVVVVPRGLATVIFFAPPAGPTRADVDRCLGDANDA